MSRPGCWARSPPDYHAHLPPPENDHPTSVLKTRCGNLTITSGTQHEQPPPSPRRERRYLVILTDSDTQGPRDE